MVNMNRSIKVVYYVDVDDDTKGCLCAIPSDKDMRDNEVVEFIANEIKSVFEPIHNLMGEHSMELAKAIAHHEFADMYEYNFGIEEIPLFKN